MKIADLIDRLIEIHNSKKNYNPEVTVMMEADIDKKEYQFQSLVTDVASSERCGVIIIGKELD